MHSIIKHEVVLLYTHHFVTLSPRRDHGQIFYELITPELRTFIEAQHLFFTASATAESRVNLSPKGMDTLRLSTSAQLLISTLQAAATRQPRTQSGLRVDDDGVQL